MIKLKKKSLKLLTKCLENHNPSLIPIVLSDGYDHNTVDFYNDLRQCIGDELVANGFQPDWEPNEYGLELERLIDEIGRLFMPRPTKRITEEQIRTKGDSSCVL